MLPEMVDDMLKIVLDPFYPPSTPEAIRNFPFISKHSLTI